MTRQEILAIAKPILFNTEMVRAILNNQKTVTRRVIKLPHCGYFEHEPPRGVIPPYKVGDILYVRETWRHYGKNDDWYDTPYFVYKADYANGAKGYWFEDERLNWCDLPKWTPSIHMPKEASRIFLRVTDIRVERLQDITEKQAKAEGVITNDAVKVSSYRYWFEQLWDSISPKNKNKFKCPEYSWNTNPWVWVIEFERIEVK